MMLYTGPDGREEERVRIPRQVHPALIGRLLFLAGLDPFPGAGPQEGRIPPERLREPGRAPRLSAPVAVRSEGGAGPCELRWSAPG